MFSRLFVRGGLELHGCLVHSPGITLFAKTTKEEKQWVLHKYWRYFTSVNSSNTDICEHKTCLGFQFKLDAKSKAAIDFECEAFNPALTLSRPRSSLVMTSSQRLCYDKRDVIMYALGVGATVDNPEDLKFLYEGHKNFALLPTYLTVPALKIFLDSGFVKKAFPGKNISSAHLLHAEQYLEILHPLPTSGTLQSHAKIVDILDKGSGAIVIVDVKTLTEQEEVLAYNQMAVFVVGAGGFGGRRVPEEAVTEVAAAPCRTPDASMEQRTLRDQAAIYRLSGDWNPLHIDPSIAGQVAFPRPVLHGLCTLGFSARHVLQRYASNDTSKFKAVKVRFVKPVYPGETLRTDMWQEGSRIHFETKVSNSGTTVISGAYVDLTDVTAQV